MAARLARLPKKANLGVPIVKQRLLDKIHSTYLLMINKSYSINRYERAGVLGFWGFGVLGF